MRSQRIDKMGEGRWSSMEDAVAPRYTVLVLFVLLLAYGLVGAIE